MLGWAPYAPLLASLVGLFGPSRDHPCVCRVELDQSSGVKEVVRLVEGVLDLCATRWGPAPVPEPALVDIKPCAPCGSFGVGCALCVGVLGGFLLGWVYDRWLAGREVSVALRRPGVGLASEGGGVPITPSARRRSS